MFSWIYTIFKRRGFVNNNNNKKDREFKARFASAGEIGDGDVK